MFWGSHLEVTPRIPRLQEVYDKFHDFKMELYLCDTFYHYISLSEAFWGNPRFLKLIIYVFYKRRNTFLQNCVKIIVVISIRFSPNLICIFKIGLAKILNFESP